MRMLKAEEHPPLAVLVGHQGLRISTDLAKLVDRAGALCPVHGPIERSSHLSGTLKRDDDRQLHNCLRPYLQLPLVETGKDRDAIRHYPDVGRAAEMKIVFT